MSKKITLALIGAGGRGLYSYGPQILKYPNASIVAVAEPKDYFRNEAVRQHGIPAENIFTSWEQLLRKPKLADAVMITTSDSLHKEPAVMAAKKGYHILLEKPMAPTARECVEITDAVKENKVILAVCHVLRYAPYYVQIKNIIESGALGKICTLQHLEGVGWWHQAHSFVRGNWRNSKESSFMLLAKSCHDMDIINWWIRKRCLNVSSFGHLKHFIKANKPAEAASRCIDCVLADDKCPYSAKRFYFEKLNNNDRGWPLAMMIEDFTAEALEKELRSGPYGRCVYECDNDVVDHQVVAMEFDEQITANFTMTAFTPGGRKTRIMGSMGYLEGDDRLIRVFDFNKAVWTEYDMELTSAISSSNHGGGDVRIVQSFIEAVVNNNPAKVRTGPDETLQSHMMVFAAEKSRLTKTTINMAYFYNSIKKA